MRDEREALNALPGYREALAQANSSEEARLRLIELTPQIAAIQGEYSARSENRTAERERLVAVFAALDASDIRQLFRRMTMIEELSPAIHSFHLMCHFLTRSKNTQAVLPLIERLQNPVMASPEPDFSNAFERLTYTLKKHTIGRSTYRDYDEIHRAADHIFTLRALGCLEDRRAEATIRPFLNDADAEVRKVAQEALWSIAA